MDVSERALNRSDRELLKPYSAANAKRSNYLSFAGFSFFLFVALFVAAVLLWDFLSWIVALPDIEAVKWWLCGVSAVASLAFSGRWTFAEHKLIASNTGMATLADEDLRNGIAVVEHLEVVTVVEVEEEDDEGAGFLLELKDGRVLFLVGQHLYPYSLNAEREEKAEAECNVFPSNKLDLSYAPRSGIVLDAEGKGHYLKPRSRVRWLGDGPRSKPYKGPVPDSFNDGPLEDLIERSGFVEEPV